jgi:hypothetical protein
MVVPLNSTSARPWQQWTVATSAGSGGELFISTPPRASPGEGLSFCPDLALPLLPPAYVESGGARYRSLENRSSRASSDPVAPIHAPSAAAT